MKERPLSRQRVTAQRALAGLGPWIEGSLCQAPRGGRPRWQLTDRPAGRTRTLYVPVERVREVRQWTANWKRAKELLRTLSELSRQELRAQAGRAAGSPPRSPTSPNSRPG